MSASPTPPRRALGVLAALGASAAAHEFILYHVTGAVTGEWAAFFLLHGGLLCGERCAREHQVVFVSLFCARAWGGGCVACKAHCVRRVRL